MIIDELKFVSSQPRYKKFTILENPVKFCNLFRNQDIECVQVHSINFLNDKSDIFGFVGCFRWENNKIHSEDEDVYYKGTLVFGYNWFNHDGEQCLDILVLDW